MGGEADPYAVLGVAHGASDADIHSAYRAAVRRTHPDAGGSATAFEAVQEAYEVLRDPGRRATWDSARAHVRAGARARPAEAGPRVPAPDPDLAGASMDELLAQSRRLEAQARRLEAQARRLAGLAQRHGAEDSQDPPEPQDSFGAIARDAGVQLRDAADKGAQELRRIVRRWV